MKSHPALATARALALAALAAGVALAQGTLADYQRAQGLQAKARGLVVGTPAAATWIGDSGQFWYSRTAKGGSEFLMVDAANATKKPAFDHDKLATAINGATGGHYTGLALPFAPPQGGRGGGAAGAGRGAAGAPPQTAPLRFIDTQSIEFGTGGSMYTCKLADYTCAKGGAIPAAAAGRGRGGAPEAGEDIDQPMPMEVGRDPVDGLEYQPFPQQGGGGGRGGAANAQPPCAPVRQAQGQGGGRGGRGGRGGAATTTTATVGSQILGQVAGAPPDACASFDGKWEAFIENYNVFLRPAGAAQPAASSVGEDYVPTAGRGRGNNTAPQAFPLSYDGSEGNYYTLRSVAWSPDSKHLVAYHTRPGYDRQVHY